MALRIMLADDHRIVREGLQLLLERQGFQVVGAAADGHQAVRLALAHNPDIAVLDLFMPAANGVDAAREIVRARPRTRVILLSVYSEDHQIVAAIRAGVRGYVLKTQASDELTDAIRQVAGGNVYLSPSISRTAIEACVSGAEIPADPLTPEEREVLGLVAEGKTSKEIAVTLGLSVKRAQTYRVRLMQKLNARNTAGLVRCAIRRAIIQLTAIMCTAGYRF